MKQYLDLLEKIVHSSTYKDDRTGTGTFSLFGHQMRFDLSEGFPLVTTKKVHFKSIVHELLWFLKGDTNIKYLQENGVRIWNEWRQPYSLNRDVVFIDPVKSEFDSPYLGDFSTKGLNAAKNSVDDKLRNLWVKMMKRCYDSSSHNFHLYGALGVRVCKAWHDVQVFVDDVKQIPHWYYKLNDWSNFELDKDYYGSKLYSKDTCVWLRTDENNLYTKATKPLEITDDMGVKKFYISLNNAASSLNIPSSTLSRFVNENPKILKGNNKQFVKWSFQVAELNGKLPRFELIKEGSLGPVYGEQWRNFNGINQLTQVIDRIKKNPDCRRIIVSAWNPAEIDNMALPPCHCLFQFVVIDGKLSCQLYQRSADVFLGVPFNIASYSLLTMMMAQVCGLEAGEFVHTIGDAHLYINHMEQAKIQLSRQMRALPTVRINPDVKDIFSFQFEDFELIDYNPHPPIKAKVAV